MQKEASCALVRSPVRVHLAPQHLKVQHMDAYGEQQETVGAVAATVLENEAESLQSQEEKSAAAELNNLNSCPVCCLNFYSREPKLLPCLHSFCKKCLPAPSRNLALAVPTNSPVDGVKPLNVIRCPVCRQECMEVDVMENVFVMDSVDPPSSTVQRSAQICMTCNDNTEAVGFCLNCVEYLCATCVVAHRRVKFTKDHTITNKEEVSKEIHGWSTQKLMFCGIHKQELLRLFCETCGLLTCRDCQLVRHRDHSYQFLEDAYEYHKQRVQTMTQQLQDKKKLIEEVSNTIDNRLHQTEHNHSSVQAEIKNSICSLIVEMNKKGQILLNQLENATKDHKSVLLKQKEDIGYLSRHLDHVISFAELATARNQSMAFLHCKRLIMFQMGNLLQTKCKTSFVPQSIIHFQGRSSSTINLGSLLVESTPSNQLPGFQDIPYLVKNPRQGPSGFPHSIATGSPQNALAQLQMQVQKPHPPGHWQTQSPWTLCQTIRLPRPGPETLHRPAPSHSIGTQLRCRFVVPPLSHTSLPRGLPNPGFLPQQRPRLLGSSSNCQPEPRDEFSSPLYLSSVPVGDVASPQSRLTVESPYLNKKSESVFAPKRNHPHAFVSCGLHRNVQEQENSAGHTAISQEEDSGCVFLTSAETHQTSGDDGPPAMKRQKPSPGPFIIIKDESDDDLSYSQVNKRTSVPDSTGDQPDRLTLVTSQDEEDMYSRQKTEGLQSPNCTPRDHNNSDHQSRWVGGEELREGLLNCSDRGLCTVCGTGGKLLSCNKCSKQFHLPCHIPALLIFPSGCWLCSFCLDFEMGSESHHGDRGVKTESGSEGFLPADKRKCERLLLRLFCIVLSPAFGESPMACASNRKNRNGPTKLHSVRKRLEASQSLCYQNVAEFVSDVRQACRNCSLQSDLASAKLSEQFEEHLRNVFEDQTFPEMTPSSSSVS